MLLCLALSNCASVRPISGGQKDEDPPIPIAFYPPNPSVNFQGKTLQIAFNEFIEIKNYRKEIIMTPFVKNYTFSSKRKRVTLKFRSPLLDSTTYILNFRNSIVDFNEKKSCQKYPICLQLWACYR